jgi:triosephosphate isomerase (TIM)
MIPHSTHPRRPLIVGNWKMNKTVPEAILLVKEIIKAIGDKKPKADVDVVICPPFVALSEVAKILAPTNVRLGAQNMHQEASGAYTGEISADMLRSVGVRYVILGHSERRLYFQETDVLVNQKVIAALKSQLTPIICVGETLQERESGETFSVIHRQLLGALASISNEQASSIVIAYEPVWAIGTGKTATPEIAQAVHAYIHQLLSALFGQENADTIPLLYGGSMKPDNAHTLLSQPDINGGLIGGASLTAGEFGKIIQ